MSVRSMPRVRICPMFCSKPTMLEMRPLLLRTTFEQLSASPASEHRANVICGLVEAIAPDGLIEAFSAPGAAGFALGVQWHPEWKARANPVSMRLLEAFGRAARAYRGRAGSRPASPVDAADAPHK